MKHLQDGDFREKNVLVRVDFNVNLKNGDVRQQYKMQAAKDTVDYILSHGARCVALLSHLGRPDGQEDPSLSLSQITDDIKRILGYHVQFVKDCSGEMVRIAVENAESGTVLLLENVRFHAGEEENDKAFALALSEPFDIFVNDAFSVCHRAHASTVGVPNILESYPGIYLDKEMDILSIIKKEVTSPSVAIVGGAKIATKLPLIEMFSKVFDVVLVGGKIANEAIDQKVVLPKNVILPHDFEEDRLDIGVETRARFVEYIAQAKTIVWNGPLGKFEEEAYSKGTFEVARAIADCGAFSVVGGGESIEALEDLTLIDQVGFVSTGGGAMLDYLTDMPMPGLEALGEKK